MTSQIADVWDAEAATFDQEPDHGLLDADVRTAWAVLLRDELPSRCSVLDLGCGTGSLSVLLGEQGHTVTGLDLSAKMLQRAQRKAERHGVAVRFVLGDASSPPMKPAFSAVLARHVLWALADPATVLDRWLSLLKPDGGTLVLIEGRWSTGGGIRARDLAAILEPKVARMSVRHLTDTSYWGRTITDERYVITASTDGAAGRQTRERAL